jgi:glycosyltransferase involved in cell wall biosynthesis
MTFRAEVEAMRPVEGTKELVRPLVSVALTTFNVEPFLGEALAGIRAQDYRPLELVAYDDASTDDSVAMLEEFRDSAAFPVKVLVGSTNIGPLPALKQALRACAGDYVAILDGDDSWLPGKLSAQVDWLEADQRRVLCGHDVECFESDTGKVLWTTRARGLLRTGSGAKTAVRDGPMFPTSSIMLRRAAIPENFNPLGLDGYNDWNLWADCLVGGGRYGYVPGLYSRYRRNPRGSVARVSGVPDRSEVRLEASLRWLGALEARHPEYHAVCRFRRATLMANHGRLLFESGQRGRARSYITAALPEYGHDCWKGAGLLAIMSLPPRMSARAYWMANRARDAIRRFITGHTAGRPLRVRRLDDWRSANPPHAERRELRSPG